MNLIRAIALLILSVIIFSGCLKVETNVKVNKDGSGKVYEKVLMSKTFVDMISQFAQSFGDTSEADEFSLFNEEELKESGKEYGQGVEYVTGKKISTDKWEGFEAVYSFTDLNNIRLKPDPAKKIDVGMNQDKDDPGEEYYFFKFIKGEVPEVIIDRPDIESKINVDADTTQDVGDDSEIGEEFFKMMEGMSIKVTMEFDGDIVKTNARYVDDSKITFVEMNIAEMMKKKDEFKEFMNREPENLDELEEFVEEFPGMKIEFQKPVVVKFK